MSEGKQKGGTKKVATAKKKAVSTKEVTPVKEEIVEVVKKKSSVLEKVEGHPVLDVVLDGNVARIRTKDGLGYTLPISEYSRLVKRQA